MDIVFEEGKLGQRLIRRIFNDGSSRREHLLMLLSTDHGKELGESPRITTWMIEDAISRCNVI
jgi:hypothetical protein